MGVSACIGVASPGRRGRLAGQAPQRSCSGRATGVRFGHGGYSYAVWVESRLSNASDPAGERIFRGGAL